MTRDMRTREQREHDRRMGEPDVCADAGGCSGPVYRKGLCRECYDAMLEDKAEHDAELWREREVK